MEAVNQNYRKAIKELESQLLYLKQYWLSKEMIVENYIWFSISSDWAYSPEIQKLTPTRNLDNSLVHDVSYCFPINLTQTHMMQFQYCISCLDTLYHHIVSCNPNLEKESIGNLIVASLEQNYHEHTR